MYLLIPFLKAALDASSTYLHPTMYLLIPTVDIIKQYIQSHLHPTMYLLILVPGIFQCRIEYIFTSHYVSINSRAQAVTFSVTATFTSHYVSINSSFIKLNRHTLFQIYIPLCIY